MNRRLRGVQQEMERICPTRVGMNRNVLIFAALSVEHLPHTRGDEPRPTWPTTSQPRHLPHTRGDEPDDDRALADVYANHLPHTRGDEPIGRIWAGQCAKASAPHAWG